LPTPEEAYDFFMKVWESDSDTEKMKAEEKPASAADTEKLEEEAAATSAADTAQPEEPADDTAEVQLCCIAFC